MKILKRRKVISFNELMKRNKVGVIASSIALVINLIAIRYKAEFITMLGSLERFNIFYLITFTIEMFAVVLITVWLAVKTADILYKRFER